MDYAFYIATVLGALAVWLVMPSTGSKPKKLGALLGLAALGGGLMFLLRQADAAGSRPDVFYYVFTAIAAIAAVRVITHPRPVYAALYFVLVVLAVAGLFIVLEAEFMAFALVIIYAGAILVTYLFVIMLATLPQAPGQEEQTPAYDRVAREPFSSVVLGFALLAVLGHVIFAGKPGEMQPTQRYASKGDVVTVVNDMPKRAMKVLAAHDLLPGDLPGVQLWAAGDRKIVATWGPTDQRTVNEIQVTDELRAELAGQIANIDRVGLALFESHPLGIELAGVILLLSMVGAIVIGKKRVLTEIEEGHFVPPAKQ
ncbi:MAG: NADH-quinone oxidoreductase subunit J family protein [Phycisphaerales bacterium]